MSPPSQAPTPGAHVVLAVKDLLQAKSRLAGVFAAEHRAQLTLAMLTDTIAAARRSAEVAAVHVVTRDSAVAEEAARRGAGVIADPPTEGLNAALEHAANTVGARWVVALQPDLAALRPGELTAALVAAREGGHRCFTADRHGSGTTLLSSREGALQPLFGTDSAASHAHSEGLALTGTWPGLRCDVDTLADLAEALLLGVGPATGAVLGAVGTPATVVEQTGGVVLLRTDDGSALRSLDAAALLGGWRQLRPGQRLRAYRDSAEQVVLLTSPAVTAPG